MHPLLLHNGRIHKTTEALLLPGQVGFLNGWGVFSTMRVDEGVLFCYERHFHRMQKDADRLRVTIPSDAKELAADLLKLVDANKAFQATLRVAIVRNTGGLFEAPDLTRKSDVIAFTTDLRDWGKGVRLGYKANARFGAGIFAGAKYTSWAENLTLYEEAHRQGFDEYVLLNEIGHVSECTSANIFIVRGDEVSTPPVATSGCLPGVTRALLLEEISVPGLTLREKEITPTELEQSDTAFLTSSTRDVLPISEIDGHFLGQAPERVESIRKALLEYRHRYVRQRRHEPVSA